MSGWLRFTWLALANQPPWNKPSSKERIAAEGPLSSLDYDGEKESRVNWFWGSTKLARAAMEVLFAKGELGIHRKVGTRRVFDRIENLLPDSLLSAPDPNATLDAYHDWHVSRRGGIPRLPTLRLHNCA